MKPKEIKEAMLAAGVLYAYKGIKWDTHYDPRAAMYSTATNERHGNTGPRPADLTRWRRCSVYETDEHGIIRQTGTCDCHKDEWITPPKDWYLALIELLDECQEEEDRIEHAQALADRRLNL